MALQNSTSMVKELLNVHNTNLNTGPEERTLVAMIAITVQLVVICGVICLVGIITNIINIIVFLKQGLDNTINISLFWLAVADLCSLLTMEWTSICNNPLVIDSDVPLDTKMIMYISGGWPHLCFGHIACWITAYITAERCLCIALPLKVKKIITPRRTSIIIGILYLINILTFIPECTLVHVDYVFNPAKNSSWYTLVISQDQGELRGVAFILLAVLGTACFPAVILFTVILVVRLRHQAKWRHKSTQNVNQTDASAKRETRTMKMVALVAVILIVSYTPGILASVVSNVDPGFSFIGNKSNMFMMIWSAIFIFEAVNSSVNIFLYYRMSTKYKKTFHEVMGACVRGGDKSASNDNTDCE